MDLKNIQELIKLVKKADISELSVRDGDFAVTIKNKSAEQGTVISSPSTLSQQSAKPSGPQPETKQETAAAKETAAINENILTFRSPMVGTFYRKPGSDKDAFVKVGDTVKSGDALCIIEAMKLFNEIEFDGPDGKILKVLADDASPVEYDQPLFLIEKS